MELSEAKDKAPDVRTKRLFVTGKSASSLTYIINKKVWHESISVCLSLSLPLPYIILIVFIGLSFYTSEKTLRAAFEGFGELVEGLKLCIDKSSLCSLFNSYQTILYSL